MGKNRLEAFSDGVIAIIITIMVLEMKIPHGDSLTTLAPIVPVFLSYMFDFTLGTHPISTKGTTQFSGAKRRSDFDCLQ